MKKSILIIFLFISYSSFSQATDKVDYTGGDLYMAALDADTEKELFSIPIGKIMFITFDKFYKSYNIIYNYKNQGITSLKFSFLKVTENGNMLVSEETEGLFYVFDNIKSIGNLLFIGNSVTPTESGGIIKMFEIKNIPSK